MTPVLEVHNLTKSFGGIEAVHKVSFSLKKGEVFALIGPNGAGKTTCFNMIMGKIRPDHGTVFLKGQPISAVKPRKIWRLGVGRTFQVTATYPSMTVLENVQMALISHHGLTFSLLRRARNQFIDEARALLNMVGMEDQAARPASILAYGDLKRLELAIALTNAPKLLLMDEPTAGMPAKERQDLMHLIARIVNEQELSILFTEHDMDIVFANAHRIMVLDRGRVIAQGSASEIRQNETVKKVYLGSGIFVAGEESA